MARRRVVLSIFFGDHDSNVAVATDDGAVLHLEAERVLGDKHVAATAEQMDEVVDAALSAIDVGASDVAEVLVARWSSRYDLSQPITIGGRAHVPTITGHHANHLGTALPFGRSRMLILCADGGSEDGATSLYLREGGEVRRIAVLDDSFLTGRVYGTATQMTIQPDFMTAHASDTGKMMGLAAYGEHDPELASSIRADLAEINRVHPEGVEELCRRHGLAGPYQRWPDAGRRRFAATVQREWEDELLEVAGRYASLAGTIAIVGGCAMNVVANGRLATSGLFDRVVVPAMPTDAGQALGALWDHHPALATRSPYLGRDVGVRTTTASVPSIADDLLAGRVVALCTGRSESGPRALGNRSILALPSSDDVRIRVSEDIKGRERYRPIAPVVRVEDVHRYFRSAVASPYMSFASVARSETRRVAPAIVHVDGSSRVQTVSPRQHATLHAVLGVLAERGAPPIVANTSMNVAGQPMVDTAEDAIAFFEETPVDVMYLGDHRTARS